MAVFLAANTPLYINELFGVPNGIRTRVAGLKGRRPRPG